MTETGLSPFVESFKDPTSLYEPFAEDEIRVLKIHGTKTIHSPLAKGTPIFETVIWCTLEPVAVSDVRNGTVQYEALSYVWGALKMYNHILVNEVVKPVTANLYAALYHIMLIKGPDLGFPMVMWVDAICINQEDPAEKTQQVATMGEIYRLATRVLVWLGTAAEEAGPHLDEFWNFSNEAENVSTSAAEAGLACSTRCEWFRRAWCFQELVLAKTASVVHGLAIVSWDKFCARVRAAGRPFPAVEGYDLSDHRSTLGKMCRTVIDLDRERRTGKSESLLRLLAINVDRKATDPRDRIFSLLGAYCGPHRLDISYDQSLEEINMRTTIAIIKGTGYIMGFPFSNDPLYQDRSTGKLPDFSTWHINWHEATSDFYTKMMGLGDKDCIKQC